MGRSTLRRASRADIGGLLYTTGEQLALPARLAAARRAHPEYHYRRRLARLLH